MHSDEIDCVGNVDRDDVDQSGRVVDSQFNDTGKVLDKDWKILVGLKQRSNHLSGQPHTLVSGQFVMDLRRRELDCSSRSR